MKKILILMSALHAVSALALTSDWVGPGSDFQTASNWDNGIPNDVAVFKSSSPTSITNMNGAFNSIVFSPGGAAYALTVSDPASVIQMNGVGIVNNSGQNQTINNNSGNFNFNNNATAANATIINGENMQFKNSSTAGTATIGNSGNLTFQNAATAANAVITNSATGIVTFTDSANAGNALITSNGGSIELESSSTGGNAAFVMNSNSALNIMDSATAGNGMITLNGGLLSTSGSGTTGNAVITVNNGGSIDMLQNSTLGNSQVIVNAGGIMNSLNTASSITAGSIAGAGSFELGIGSFTVGGNNQSTTVSGDISGDGALIKVGTGLLTLTSLSGYAGSISVNNGGLTFINALNGDVMVGAAGTLTAGGSMLNLTNNGLVITGVGATNTLSVSKYSGSGTLQIHFNGSSISSLQVAGNANITGGKLSLIGGGLSVGRYTVISAGSLTGTFASVTTPVSSFLTYQPEYTPTDVLMLINFASPFSPGAQSGNQRSVAAALDGPKSSSTSDFTTAISAIAPLSSDGARNAYNQISGDALASLQSVGLRSAAVFIDQMRDRAEPSQEPVNQAMLAPPVQLAYLGDVRDLETPSAPSPSYGLWSRGVGFFDHTHADSAIGSPASHASTGGFQAGYDYLLSEDFLFGLSGGYAKTNLNVDDRSMSGQTTSLQSGIYASFTPGAWIFNGAFAYTGLANDTARSIEYPGVNEQADANFNGRVLTTYAQVRYELKPLDTFSLEPSFSLRQSHLQQDGFTETGAPGLNLMVGGQDVNSLVSALGARLTHRFFAVSGHPFTLGTSAGWEHEFQDVDDTVSAAFSEAAGTNFTVQGTPRSRNAMALGLDARMTLRKELQAYMNYSALIGSEDNTQEILGGLSVKW